MNTLCEHQIKKTQKLRAHPWAQRYPSWSLTVFGFFNLVLSGRGLEREGATCGLQNCWPRRPCRSLVNCNQVQIKKSGKVA